ncbi:TolC family outer membrane protein [Paracoccus sp. Z330]|uniref:TolC family outer membrane protein n=1 Tax=Paracoccus onchidii TaxID=3017813 RepID=A0ABT4ZH84_9RHOB|nr:TolC family outer membrane protein [Paracoccus onchidii]MDB6178723.1 TolC family outer membrane protein [Paracoccus onchidii]
MRLRRISMLLTVAAGTLMSGPVFALSAKDAVLYVLETNPEIKAAEANKQAIEFELDQSRAFRVPKFELEAWAGSSLNNGTTTSDLTASDDPISGYQVRGRMTQVLFDGFRTRSEIERQAYRVDAAALRVLERSEFLSLEAIRLYADVLRAGRLVALAQDNLTYHQRLYDRLQGGFDSGALPVGDIQQAQERVFLAEDTLISFQLDAQDIRDNFLAVVGVQPENLGSLPSIGGAMPGSLDEALAIARRNNPTVRFTQADVGTAEARAREANANRYPTLNLEADVLTGRDVNGFEGDVDDARIGLTLRYEFQGGRKRAARQEQVRRTSQSRAEMLQQARRVDKEVRNSWANLDAARKRKSVVQDQANLSRDLRATYEEEYEVGVRSLLDILNTQNALFQAEANLVNANSLEEYVRFRVLASMGMLLPSLGIEPPEDATPYAVKENRAPSVSEANQAQHFDAKSFSDWRRTVGN